jgi:lipopolysaccharide/colanic/teichoic acid biosynthesis glycosyltransferase
MMVLQELLRRTAGLIIFTGLFPVNMAIALLLRVFQGPRVLFVQQRSGLGGRPFNLVKFRTMRDLRDHDGRLFADEARVTAIGSFLRRTRFDELPSFWNVVTGDLVFIGPRPILPVTIKNLGARGIRRGTVRPGLTGWAQINGNTKLTLDEKVELDLWYIDHGNWRTDVSVVSRTFWVMAAGEKRGKMLK